MMSLVMLTKIVTKNTKTNWTFNCDDVSKHQRIVNGNKGKFVFLHQNYGHGDRNDEHNDDETNDHGV